MATYGLSEQDQRWCRKLGVTDPPSAIELEDGELEKMLDITRRSHASTHSEADLQARAIARLVCQRTHGTHGTAVQVSDAPAVVNVHVDSEAVVAAVENLAKGVSNGFLGVIVLLLIIIFLLIATAPRAHGQVMVLRGDQAGSQVGQYAGAVVLNCVDGMACSDQVIAGKHVFKITATGVGGVAYYQVVKSATVSLAARGAVNFFGGLTCADNAGTSTTDCQLSSASFDKLTAGTNTAGAMVLGTGSSLTYSGTGTNNASHLGGKNLAAIGNNGDISFNWENPSTADTGKFQHHFSNAVTIQRLYCSTDTGTVSINLEKRAENTPNSSGSAVLLASLICGNVGASSTTFVSAGITVNQLLTPTITATSGSPTLVRVHVYTQP